MPWTKSGNIKGAPRFMEVASTTTNASGAGAVTFASAFTAAPTVIGLVTFSGNTMAFPIPSSVTKTGCAVSARVSRGTLLLSDGPFQAPTTATQVSVLAMGS